MRKFALVSHVLPPSWSGQSIVLGRLLKDFNPESYIPISRMDFASGIKGYHLSSLIDRFHLNSLLYHPLFTRFPWLKFIVFQLEFLDRSLQIAKIVKNENCSCIVACTGDLFDIPAAHFAGVMTKREVFPYYFDDYVYQWPDPFYRRFAQHHENLIFKRCSNVIVPNEFMKDELFERQQITATIIRNPVNPDSTRISVQHSLSNQTIKIVYTGAVYHVNSVAFRTLITAMESIKEINLELHLYTAQPVDFLKSEGVFGDKVHIYSHASSKETALAQQEADILYIPFSFDTKVPEVIRTSAPGKLADYLSSGVPILAFVPPDTFVAWFFKKHLCGLVVDENNPQVLANGIIELVKNTHLRKTIIQNALELAADEFDVHKASKRLFDIINESNL